MLFSRTVDTSQPLLVLVGVILIGAAWIFYLRADARAIDPAYLSVGIPPWGKRTLFRSPGFELNLAGWALFSIGVVLHVLQKFVR